MGVSPSTTTTLAQHWGAAIADRRRHVGLTQATLAGLLGVEQQTVSKWENGETTPREANKVAIARCLGSDVATLFAYPEGLA